MGLLQLREGSPFTVFATRAVLGALTDDLPVRRTLGCYSEIDWREVDPGARFHLDGGLAVDSLALDGEPPRYAARSTGETGWVVAYRFADTKTGASVVYAPAVQRWTAALQEFASDAQCVFFDGTFWTDGELRVAAGRPLSAAETGHLPISGDGGSAVRLAALRAGRKVYVHINNTNPILDERAAERDALGRYGIEVGHDGMELQLR